MLAHVDSSTGLTGFAGSRGPSSRSALALRVVVVDSGRCHWDVFVGLERTGVEHGQRRDCSSSLRVSDAMLPTMDDGLVNLFAEQHPRPLEDLALSLRPCHEPMRAACCPTSALHLTREHSIRQDCSSLFCEEALVSFFGDTISDMATSWNWKSDSKLCFVTTGATAPFTALIESVLSPSALDALLENGFTHLLIQYGSAKDVFTKASIAARSHVQVKKQELVIDGIDFNPDGLQAQLRLVQQSRGLVISHAGSGSILEALRYHVPLIVVPNTGLLDNHQEELAVAMERSGYLLRGHVEYADALLPFL